MARTSIFKALLVILMAIFAFSPVAYAVVCNLDVADIPGSPSGDERMTLPTSMVKITVLGAYPENNGNNDYVHVSMNMSTSGGSDTGFREIWQDARNQAGNSYSFGGIGTRRLILRGEGKKQYDSDSSSSNVEILKNGDNWTNVAAAGKLSTAERNHLIAIFNSLPGQHYWQNGHIEFGGLDKAIVIYELDTTGNPNFDMDDLVLLVDVDCSFTVVANNIVCTEESDLPDCADGECSFVPGPDYIDQNTAQNWVNLHPGCSFAQNWTFEWAQGNVANPGDNTGEAGGSWHPFGPTNSSGSASVEMGGVNDSILVREAWKTGFNGYTNNGYIQFAGIGQDDGTFSAELYCHEDLSNYDNYDKVEGPVMGSTYYCVAWNVPYTYCGDGQVQGPNARGDYEECDGSAHCSAACKLLPYCGDGNVGVNEQCDGGAGCDADCTWHTYCGDGEVQAANDDGINEQCDDGNNVGGDGCSAQCATERGGNGAWAPSEDQRDSGPIIVTITPAPTATPEGGQPAGPENAPAPGNNPQPLTAAEGALQPVQFVPGSFWAGQGLPVETPNEGAGSPGAPTALLITGQSPVVWLGALGLLGSGSLFVLWRSGRIRL